MDTFVGYAATAASCGTMVPQIAKVLRTRKTDDLSVAMIALNALSSSLWGIYGAMHGQAPLVVSSVLSTTFALALLALKLRLTAGIMRRRLF